MLTTARQLQAARALIGWSQHELAKHSGVSIGTVRRIEAGEGQISCNVGTLSKIQSALELAGLEFLNYSKPGVRIR